MGNSTQQGASPVAIPLRCANQTFDNLDDGFGRTPVIWEKQPWVAMILPENAHRLGQFIMPEMLIAAYTCDPSPTHRHISGIGKATPLFIHTKVFLDVYQNDRV